MLYATEVMFNLKETDIELIENYFAPLEAVSILTISTEEMSVNILWPLYNHFITPIYQLHRF